MALKRFKVLVACSVARSARWCWCCCYSIIIKKMFLTVLAQGTSQILLLAFFLFVSWLRWLIDTLPDFRGCTVHKSFSEVVRHSNKIAFWLPYCINTPLIYKPFDIQKSWTLALCVVIYKTR